MPTPYTIHPTPYTLHPAPYTMHPTPYTVLAYTCNYIVNAWAAGATKRLDVAGGGALACVILSASCNHFWSKQPEVGVVRPFQVVDS